MDAQLEELKRLCAAATQGNWQLSHEVFDNDDCPETPITALDGAAFVAVALDWGNNNPMMREHNAAFIAAANPATVSDLITRLQKALVDADRYRWLRDRNDWYAEPRIDAENGTRWQLTFYSPARIEDPTDDANLDTAIDAARVQEKNHV